MPFGTKIAKTQHFSDQKWEVVKSGSRRKAIRFGVGLAVISGKHTEDPSRLAPTGGAPACRPHTLWAIDNEAYGEASITYERFKDWWQSFPSGLHALFFRTRVMGAIGIWPLSARSAGFLTTAHLKESQLTGRTMHTFVSAPAHFWYISGIVLRPELIGGRAIKILLSHGIGSWLITAQFKFPCQLLALAYSDQGQALLEGFNFFKLQNAKVMPDNAALFALQVSDREHLLSSLKAKGLDVAG